MDYSLSKKFDAWQTFFLYGAFIEKDKNFGYGDERAMTIRVAHFQFDA